MGLLSDFKRWLRLRDQEMEIRSLAVGMNSTVDIIRDLHIVMLDFDIDDIKQVRESIWELQQFWLLADADIYRTRHGFHVFFWYDIVPYDRLKMIINYARYVDPMYKYISRYYDHKTIRVSGKYVEKDISFSETMKGVRSPTREELELGSMKRTEREILAG